LDSRNANVGGATPRQVVYYFPVILTKSFGFSNRLALILSAVDFISLCVWGSVIMLLIDRFGRVPLMLFGSIGCGLCFTLTTIGLGVGTKASYAMAVSFMFGYHLFYVRLLPALFPKHLVDSMVLCSPFPSIAGPVLLGNSVPVPLRNQLVADAQHWQQRRHGHELAVRVRGGDHDP
jgi:hypothetical protein